MLSVVGARPEFIQSARISQFLEGICDEVLVHTGQHYDENMSGVFFSDLKIKTPKYNLGVGSGTRVWRVAEVAQRMDSVIDSEKPDCLVVRGDTDTTLGAAIAGACASVPVIHVEAGARSHDRAMPEEINRILTDHASELNLCITEGHKKNLDTEGLGGTAMVLGDPMYDVVLANAETAMETSTLLADLGLVGEVYYLVTVHRESAIKNMESLHKLVEILDDLPAPVVFPIHPQTRSTLDRGGLAFGGNVKLIDPVGYLDMLALEQSAEMILTDSGGVFREAYFFSKRCLSLRTSTELPEVMMTGWSRLVGFDHEAIAAALADFDEPSQHPDLFGIGDASERIANAIANYP